VNSNDVSLYIDNMIYSGWTSLSIKRSLEAAAGSFSLTLTERWESGSAPSYTAWPIYDGDNAVVKIGNDIVITGYVDDVSISLSSTGHSITVSGRDLTEDIVDCSAINRPGQWLNRTLEQIASDLCGPFGVSVSSDVNTGGPIAEVIIQPGETVYQTLEKIAKGRQLLITSTADGKLVFTQSSKNVLPVTLLEGENILTCEASFSSKDRFSSYTVEGQPDSVCGYVFCKASASDAAVPRYRPLLVIAEEKANQAYCKNRAVWESLVRAAKAVSASVTVQGWRTPSGDLWAVNNLINISAPSIRIDGALLITEAEFRKDNSGTTTALVLKRQDAFLPDPTLDGVNYDYEPIKSKNVQKTVKGL